MMNQGCGETGARRFGGDGPRMEEGRGMRKAKRKRQKWEESGGGAMAVFGAGTHNVTFCDIM